jgi:ABC-type glycerol-3-phosphate transport system substrate-binding protein
MKILATAIAAGICLASFSVSFANSIDSGVSTNSTGSDMSSNSTGSISVADSTGYVSSADPKGSVSTVSSVVSDSTGDSSASNAIASPTATPVATNSELSDAIVNPYDYSDYLIDTAKYEKPEFDKTIPADSFIKADQAVVAKKNLGDAHPNSIEWTNQDGKLDWNINIPVKGLYRIQLNYLPTQNRSGNIEFELSLNDKIPFEEAGQLSFERIWKDEKAISKDNRGNELRPSQVDFSTWMVADCRDKEGMYSDSFLFLFEKGVNKISLKCVRETFALASIRVYNQDDPVTYQQYSSAKAGSGSVSFEEFVEAEKATYKSDPSLYPISDRISPITRPYDASKIRLNTIGGLNWRYPGQWIEWDITVPADGNYSIALRSRQDQLRGFYSHRRIYIDGKVPFSELSEVVFPYDSSWKTEYLGGDIPYMFYLVKGTHTIRMEAIVGSMGSTIQAIEKSIYDLNYLYRKIIMITGVTPDIYRDYDLKTEIPELVGEFLRIAKVLDDELFRIEKSIGKSSTEGALLKEFAVQLRSLSENPRTITERLDRYKTNVSSLSAWMMEMKKQPLELDYLWVADASKKLPRSEGTFIEKFVHEVKAFVFSFIENYDMIGNVTETDKSISVWVGSGRDQAQIIKAMIDDLFTQKYKTGVNVSLVQGTLLEATMAGKGPDVALNVARYLPVDLAVRGALAPIDGAEGFEANKSNFQSTAFIPYTFKNHIYAMPETQEYNMMFYRKDIFAELQITPPQTWQELYSIIPLLERRNMDIGVPSLIPQQAGDTYMPFPRTFGTMLIQRGLNFYADDLSKTSFDDKKAIDAYKEFVDLYREYGLPVYYDFANRFRTGEMPIGIAPYSIYNFLYIFAPEIRNLWEMVPIPGTIEADGTINRSEEGYGSACVVFQKTKNKDSAIQFVMWWTSEIAQTRYGREMESLMGPAARQSVANQKAFANLPWSSSEIKNLKLQWDQVKEQAEIPGSYFVSRNLNNAMIETIFENGNVLATLEKYNKYINEEISRKRIEFGMDKGE